MDGGPPGGVGAPAPRRDMGSRALQPGLEPYEITANFSDLGLAGSQPVRDHEGCDMANMVIGTVELVDSSKDVTINLHTLPLGNG